MDEPLVFVAEDDAPLWRYLNGRFAEREAAARKAQKPGPARHVPRHFRHEGKVGWWFPSAWVETFEKTQRRYHSAPPRTQPGSRRPPRAFVPGSGFPGLQELERWRLPVGTIFTAGGVEYPNGARESFGSIILRERRERPSAQWMDWSRQEPTVEPMAEPSSSLLRSLERKKRQEAAE